MLKIKRKLKKYTTLCKSTCHIATHIFFCIVYYSSYTLFLELLVFN